MPNLSDIDLAQKYVEKNQETFVIFITNNYDLVFNAFSVHPFDFIKKENLDVGLTQTIKHLINKLNKIITLHDKSNIINLKCKDIIFCESYGHRCYIHTTKGIIIQIIKYRKYHCFS